MWGLYARWLKNKGDLTMCSEALLKQVRSYQGSDLWKDRDRFKRFSYASLELCKVYMEISSSSGSRRELFAAEMHLKNVLKQAEGFSDMEEFRDLHACLDELKTKLQSGPVAT
ncbi:TPR REGION domain-containing protein [Citrus sinensis]|nr:TPR REGION domain-containing protein [Citrus sinensis]